MAKKVVLIDDVTGDVIDEKLGGRSVDFSVDGSHYSLDLGVKSLESFSKDLSKWIDAATEVEAPRRGRPPGSTTRKSSKSGTSGSGRSKEDLAAIRTWAATQSIEVSPRGRIAQEILDKFDAAHPPSASNSSGVIE